MSNIYVTEPPPLGRVVLETSRGDIEVELFAKECPRACKNFIALALEGYYDNIIWHRYIPDFILQTGDPTGSGLGGESFYGEPFQDEIHSRLRFNRRGLLGMANGSERDTNESQFFLTLAPTPELQGRHTMFGRVVSNSTIYNLVALTESVGEVGDDDRPKYPPKLKTVRVLENPFEGEIQLRITREERLAIKRNKRDAERRKQEREREAAQGQKKKNTALLSFGEAEEVNVDSAFKGPKSSHDLLKNDKRLRPALEEQKEVPARKRKSTADEGAGSGPSRGKPPKVEKREALDTTTEAELSSSSKPVASADKIAELEASILGLSKNTEQEEQERRKAEKKRKGKALLEQFRQAYKQPSDAASESKSSTTRRDEETARLLQTFQKRMRGRAEGVEGKDSDMSPAHTDTPLFAAEVPEDLREYGGGDEDEDDDTSWRTHRFDFGGKSVLQDKHDEDEYVLLDPRDSASNAAAQLGFGGREGVNRAREERARQTGRRGRDWVDIRSQRAYNGRPERSDDRGPHQQEHKRPRPPHKDQHHGNGRSGAGSRRDDPYERRERGRDRSPPPPPRPRRDVERW